MLFVPTCRTIDLADSTIRGIMTITQCVFQSHLTVTFTLESDSLTGLKTLVMESPTTNNVSFYLLVVGLMLGSALLLVELEGCVG